MAAIGDALPAGQIHANGAMVRQTLFAFEHPFTKANGRACVGGDDVINEASETRIARRPLPARRQRYWRWLPVIEVCPDLIICKRQAAVEIAEHGEALARRCARIDPSLEHWDLAQEGCARFRCRACWAP